MRRSPQQLVSLPEGPGHLYLKLYQKIRSLILSGAWPAGTRLPSSRRLARDLRISRNTAILAIDQLMADGWIKARVGSGIYVSAEAPPARPTLAAPLPADALEHGDAAMSPFQVMPGGIVDLFPIKQWARIQAKVWTTATETALHEGSGAGWFPLRNAVAAHLHAIRGIQCDPAQILIVSSTQAAIDLALRVLTQPGDTVWMEDPGYPGARQALQANDLIEHPVAVDHMGMRVGDAIAAAPAARLAYVTPACQFPTCTVMAEHRRLELLAWATKNNAFIIEDDWDYNADFQATHPPEPLMAKNSERIFYIHSFNRLLFAGLRIAALVVPRALVADVVEMRQAIDSFTNVANQIALAEFIQRGMLSAHLRACRLAYLERRAALHRGILMHFPDFVTIDPMQAGLHAVAYLREKPDAPLAAAARRRGFACLALSDFSAGDPACTTQALLLGFASFSQDALYEATAKFADAIFEGVS